MITVESTSHADHEWNKRLLNSNLGTVYNTQEYALYASTLGRKPHFVKFLNSTGKIVGQVVLFENNRFEKKNMILSNMLRNTPKLKKVVYRWIYGPVILDSEFTNEICNTFSKFLLSKNAVIFGSEHPLSNGSLSCFKNSFKIQTWTTFLIDLKQDPDNIWEKLDKHSARKNIERSQKRGVYLKNIDFSNIEQYCSLLLQSKKDSNSVDNDKVKTLWNNLRTVGINGFIAFLDEKPIGGLMFTFFNNYINEWGVARSEEDYNLKLYSQDLIKWEIIQWGIKNEISYYDLTGANPNPSTKKEVGIFHYKKKFGGKQVNYNFIST